MTPRKKMTEKELEDLSLHLELQVEELRRTQLDAENAKRRYFELFNLAPFAYFTLDMRGMILEANETGMKLLGEKGRGSLQRVGFVRYIGIDDHDTWSGCRDEVLRTRGKVQCRVTIVRKDGVRLDAQIDAMPEQVDESRPKKMWVVVSDITAWKRAEEVLRRDKETVDLLIQERTSQLLKSQEQLSKAERLSDIGTLAATIAHELRNPLSAIKMAAYNIKRKKSGEPVEQHIETINKKVDDSEQIISNLLFYSRLKKPTFDSVNIASLINDTLSLTLARLEQKKVRVKTSLKSLKSISIKGDGLQLKEVFHNILNNAFDAVQEKTGVVIITGSRKKGWVEIDISDNGSGIEKENIKNLFAPFFTTKSRGTGLGLTVSKQIVSMHRGDIGIESEKGKGTTVYIRLPLNQDVLDKS